MNKFLNELDKRLNILDENERKDIINEYKDIIEEKVTHGKTEEEAVKEFGQMDSLVEEILKAYKINPKFKTTEDKIKDAAKSSEDFVKKTAKSLADFTNNVVDDVKNSNLDITLQSVFEIIVKIFLLLIGLALFRIPFYLIEGLGHAMFFDTMPFSFMGHVWSLLVWLAYLFLSVIIVMIVFKDTLFKEKNNQTKKPEPKETKTTKEKKTIKEEKVEEVKIEKAENVQKIDNVLMVILKIFLVLTFFIPMIGTLIGLSIGLSVAIYLLIKGINTIGIITAILGLFLISGFFMDLISALLKRGKKVMVYPLILGFMMLILGSIFTLETISNIEYKNVAPKDFTISKESYNYDVNSLYLDLNNQKYEIIEDDSLETNKVIIEVNYYSDFVNVEKREIRNRVSIDKDIIDNRPNNLIKTVVKDLKANEIYDYTELFKIEIKIKANRDTIYKLNIEE